MKEFFKNTKIKILLGVTLALLMLAVFTGQTENNLLSSSLNSLTKNLSSVSAAATKNNKKGKSYDELKAENEKLKKENAKLRSQVVDYFDTKEENSRLWKFYDIKKQHPDFQLIPASVLRRDVNDEFSSFTLDKGSSSGIKTGNPVVSEGGLIGWVSRVDKSTAKVVTVLSPSTSIGAKDNESKDTGIVRGSAQFSDNNQTMFQKLPSNHKVKKGHIITTTGISGLYPKGLVVGEVVDTGYDTYDSSYYAVVQPYDDIKTLTEAAVIISFDGEGEVLIGGKKE